VGADPQAQDKRATPYSSSLERAKVRRMRFGAETRPRAEGADYPYDFTPQLCRFHVFITVLSRNLQCCSAINNNNNTRGKISCAGLDPENFRKRDCWLQSFDLKINFNHIVYS
jgi:hypothetical protein